MHTINERMVTRMEKRGIKIESIVAVIINVFFVVAVVVVIL